MTSTVPPPATPNRQQSKQSCLLAVALFLGAVMLGMFGIGQGCSMWLMLGAFIFVIVAGILYVTGK